MSRRPRAVFPGVAHHITQRGNNRQGVFYSPDDCRLYLDLLGHYAVRCGCHMLGYCLMGNHIHLVAVPERPDSLARTLRPVHSEYAQAMNRAEGRSGHLWQNRFFSCPLDQEHLIAALRYVDLNPVRAGLVVEAWDWPWSSARAHTRAGAHDGLLVADWTSYCCSWDYAEWTSLLLAGAVDEGSDAVRAATRTGAPLGSAEFVTELERHAGRRLRVYARGRPKRSREVSLPESLFAEQDA